MYTISISHKTAPVNIRELFSFSPMEQEAFIRQVLKSEHILECVIVSTCNRSEVYFNGDHQAIQVMEQYLADCKNAELEDLKKYFLVYCDEKSIRHLFQVTCGMDSMVIGEDEILGQVKDAFEKALDLGSTKYHLNTSFQAAIACAKKIKTDTILSKTPVSIGTLVVNEILKFKSERKKVLIIGLTGKMGTIIMKNLSKKQNVTIVGTSRSHNSLQEIATDYKEVKIIDYRDRYLHMDDADIIISATTSPHYTITYHELIPMLPTEKERLFIDLSVPTDIDKEIIKYPKVTLYDIDYFSEASKSNIQLKEQEISRAQLIMEDQIDELLKTFCFHGFIPDIHKVKQLFEEKSFENILYDIKSKTNSIQLRTVIEVLLKLTDE